MRQDSTLRLGYGDFGRPVIEKDRDCPKWFPYQPGFAPREHVETFHVLQLEDQRKAHELQLAGIEAESRRASEQIQRDSLEIARATKATMDGLSRVASKTDQFTTTWTRVAVALAIASLLLIAFAYVFPDAGRHFGEFIAPWLARPSAQH